MQCNEYALYGNTKKIEENEYTVMNTMLRIQYNI